MSNFPIQNVDADAKLVRVVSISQAAEGARIAGASRIIGVDLNSNRFNEGERISIYWDQIAMHPLLSAPLKLYIDWYILSTVK